MSETYKNPPQDPNKPRRYSTIDQHKDGNAHPKPRPGHGPFHNKDSKVTLTAGAKKLLGQ